MSRKLGTYHIRGDIYSVSLQNKLTAKLQFEIISNWSLADIQIYNTITQNHLIAKVQRGGLYYITDFIYYNIFQILPYWHHAILYRLEHPVYAVCPFLLRLHS